MTHEELATFIHQHDLAVIATVGEQFPEAAVIEFADDGLELIFDTHNTTRKYQNIVKVPQVSFVIGWDELQTVQYEGEASLLSGEELTRCTQIYFEKNPDARKWQDEKTIVYFKVTPKWIRYSDLRTKPWRTEEFRF
jgi:general stress protein 26